MRRSWIVISTLLLVAQTALAAELQHSACVSGEFTTTSSGGKVRLITLLVTNNCTDPVDFRNSNLVWEQVGKLDTNYWGTFQPHLGYPLSPNEVTGAQIGSGRYRETISLKFGNYAKTVLPVGQSFVIKYNATADLLIPGTFKALLENATPSDPSEPEDPVDPPVATTPVAKNGRLTVCGTKLCNEKNQPVQLRGISSHGIQWKGVGSCLTEASLDALANMMGADIFRIAMYVQSGGYETNPAKFTSDVNYLVEAAGKRGMYAMIDFHLINPGDPMYNVDRAKKFFTDMANAHKGKKHIIYEIANEPNGVPWSTIRNYAMQVIPIIRAIDPDAPIIVGTPGWSSLGLSDGRTSQDIIANPLPFANIMYTFHFYAASHGDNHVRELDAASNKLPIFVTEFGTMTHTGDGPNDFIMADKYMDLMKRKQISWINWNYSDDWRTSGEWKDGVCPNGPWVLGNLKESGLYIRDKLQNR